MFRGTLTISDTICSTVFFMEISISFLEGDTKPVAQKHAAVGLLGTGKMTCHVKTCIILLANRSSVDLIFNQALLLDFSLFLLVVKTLNMQKPCVRAQSMYQRCFACSSGFL